MTEEIDEVAMKEAVEEKISVKRQALLEEQASNRWNLDRLAARNREIDRQLMECNAAAKLFGGT